MKCTCCGKTCYESDELYPTIVFQDEKNTICEECSIDYDMEYGKVVVRYDLRNKGFILPLN